MEEVKRDIKEILAKNEIQKRKSKLKNFFLGWIKDNYDKVFLFVLVIAFLIRLWIFFKTMNQPLWWDEADYLAAAKKWGLGLNIRDIWYYRRGFLFPLIGAAVYFIGLGEMGMRVLQVLFSTGIVAVSYFIVEKMFNKKLALLTSIGLTASWIFLFFTGRILTDIPATFFILLSLLFFWKGYVLKQGNKFLYLFGLFLAFSVLVRMQSLMFIPPFLIYILIKEKSKIFKNKQLWITLGIFLLTLLPMYILYSMHYGNPITDIIIHDFGIGQAAVQSGSQRVFSMAIFNYFTDLPYMLTWPIFIMLIIGTIYFFTDLFIGFDRIFKDEQLQKKLFVLVWVLSLFLIMGYIGSVSYVEERYISAGLPFLFLIAVSPIILLENMLSKYTKLNKKVISFIFIVILIALLIPNLTFSNTLINEKLTSYVEVEQAGKLINQLSSPTDIVMSNSLPQIAYYSERSTYPYDPHGDGVARGDKTLLNYSEGEAGFDEFLVNEHPKFLMASVFETDPGFILNQTTDQNNIDYITMPFFNSSMSYNAQTGQIVSLDLKPTVNKGDMTLTLVYPLNQGQLNGIFIYKVDYS